MRVHAPCLSSRSTYAVLSVLDGFRPVTEFGSARSQDRHGVRIARSGGCQGGRRRCYACRSTTRSRAGPHNEHKISSRAVRSLEATEWSLHIRSVSSFHHTPAFLSPFSVSWFSLPVVGRCAVLLASKRYSVLRYWHTLALSHDWAMKGAWRILHQSLCPMWTGSEVSRRQETHWVYSTILAPECSRESLTNATSQGTGCPLRGRNSKRGGFYRIDGERGSIHCPKIKWCTIGLGKFDMRRTYLSRSASIGSRR